MSLPTARGFGVFLGKVLYATFGKLRRNALKNLKLVYPDLPDAQRVGMAKAVFDHFGKVAAEFLQLPKLSRETATRSPERAEIALPIWRRIHG